MSKRFFRHSLNQMTVEVNRDSVVAEVPLPDGGSLNNVHGEVHVIGETEQSIHKGQIYGFDGFILPVYDPDNYMLYQTSWDEGVPKEGGDGANTFALDTTTTSVTASTFEPGISDTEQLIGINQVTEIYSRRKLLTFAGRPVGFEAVADAENHWTPTDVFDVKVSRRYRVEVPSVAMFAFSNPALTTTTANPRSQPAMDEWVFLKYLEMFLEDAWIDMMGRSEDSDDDPYEDLNTFLNDLLEPTVVEMTAGAFNPISYNIFAKFTWDVSVPGRLDSSAALTAN